MILWCANETCGEDIADLGDDFDIKIPEALTCPACGKATRFDVDADDEGLPSLCSWLVEAPR